MKRVSALLLCLSIVPLAVADNTPTPSLELLEFLGEMEQNNDGWDELFQAMLNDANDARQTNSNEDETHD